MGSPSTLSAWDDMRRSKTLLVVALMAVGGPLLAAPGDPDVAREILRRIPEWPGTEVEVPVSVYTAYLRHLMGEPEVPVPPEVAWVEKASYRLTIGPDDAAVEAAFEIVVLAGPGPRSVPLVADALAWGGAALDGMPAALRRGSDGWFQYDPPGPGRYRVTVKAPLKPQVQGDGRSAAWAVPGKAAWVVAEVESDAAWEVHFAGAPLAIVGDDKGTRGSVGVPPGKSLTATWRKPVPPTARQAEIEFTSHVGWTLGDGVHQVRASLDLLIWGGQASELTVRLPDGADRVTIAGPDVREVQVAGTSARVFLRGAITQRTRLAVTFEVPRKPSGPMALGGLGIAGGRGRGGDLAIAGGGGAVLLEMESQGLAPMAIRDLPDETRGLLAAPPVYAYTLAPGAWTARIDVVDMAEFPVRETLADSALYTVLYRPDGHVMTKVVWEVRNRGQQFMRVDLPPGATLLVARVAEVQKSLVRGPDGALYVPLEKSVLTTAGLVSFPVELVYLVRTGPLSRRGALRVPLPRTDLPVAYARCALMVPEGLGVRTWEGTLREVPRWSSETAEVEFEYGRGHLAKAPESPKVPREPPLEQLVGAVVDFAPAAEPARPESSLGDLQRQGLQGKNYYRAGVEFYNRGDYRKAGGEFAKVVEVAPESVEAENARKYLANVDVALGKGGKTGGGRAERATAKAVQRAQQGGNVEIVERQQALLEQAEQAQRSGDEAHAEAAYKVAVELAKELKGRGEEGREQEATVRKADEYLKKAEGKRAAQATELGELQKQVESLKKDVGKVVGRDRGVDAETIDALVELDAAKDVNGKGGRAEVLREVASANSGAYRFGARGSGLGRVPPRADGPAQVDVSGRALAEQRAARGGQVDFVGAAPAFRGLGTAGATLTLDDKVADLRQKVERLEGLRERLGREHGVAAPAQTEVAAPGQPPGVATTSPFPDVASNRLEEREVFGLDLGRKVAEKQRSLADQARAAAELARKGNLDEAEKLLGWTGEELGKSSRLRSFATRADAKGDDKVQGLWHQAEAARREMKFDEAGRAVGQILAARPDDERAKVWLDDLAYLAAQARQVAAPDGRPVGGAGVAQAGEEAAHGTIDFLRYPDAKTYKELTETRRALQTAVKAEPQAVAETRRRLSEEIDVDFEKTSLDNVLKYISETKKGLNIVIDPDIAAGGVDLSTRVVDLKVKQVSVESVLGLILGADLGYKVEAGYILVTTRDRLKAEVKALPETRHRFTVDAETEADASAWRRLNEAQLAVEHEKRRRASVRFDVDDLAPDRDQGRKLAEFLSRNYGWAFRSAPAQGPGAPPPQEGQAAGLPAINVNGTYAPNTVSVSVLVPAGTGDGLLNLRADRTSGRVNLNLSDGQIVVANDPNATGNLEVVLDRLRANLGQRVAVGSRNVLVDARRAEGVGLEFTAGANGVRYAVVSEGQLRGLLDLEQRSPASGAAGVATGEFRQEAVVGTSAALANGATVAIARAADDSNRFAYNGNELDVPHDDYLLVDNGRYLTAVKSGRMQHWAVDVEPVRFPGVPAAVVVPEVGRTVKFEKTLLDPKDSLELVADYTWEGEP